MTAKRLLTESEVKTLDSNSPREMLRYIRVMLRDASGPVRNPLNPEGEPPLYQTGRYDTLKDLHEKLLEGYFAPNPAECEMAQ